MIPLGAAIAGGAIGAVVTFALGYVLGLKLGWLAGYKIGLRDAGAMLKGTARLVRFGK